MAELFDVALKKRVVFGKTKVEASAGSNTKFISFDPLPNEATSFVFSLSPFNSPNTVAKCFYALTKSDCAVVFDSDIAQDVEIHYVVTGK